MKNSTENKFEVKVKNKFWDLGEITQLVLDKALQAYKSTFASENLNINIPTHGAICLLEDNKISSYEGNGAVVVSQSQYYVSSMTISDETYADKIAMDFIPSQLAYTHVKRMNAIHDSMVSHGFDKTHLFYSATEVKQELHHDLFYTVITLTGIYSAFGFKFAV